MVVAILSKSNIQLSDESLEVIINKKVLKAFAVGNPTVLLKNMTLAYLKYLTLSIHFIVNFVTIIIIQLLRVYCDCKTSAFLVQKKSLVRKFYFGLEHNLGRCH